MDWTNLYMNMAGRIGRQSWWLGTIGMFVIALILYFVLSSILGTSMWGMMANPEKMLEPGFMEGMMRQAAIQQVITLAIIGYPVTALMSKRLNDRDRPSWMKWLFWLPTIVSIVLTFAGLAYTTTDMGNGVMMPTPSTLMTIVSVASFVIGLWALIELGFLRGTDGANQHGENPLAN